MNRTATLTRNTSETQISLEINLDGSGQYQIDTPVGFLNHMLELFSRHGSFDLKLSAKGDIQFDDHHTIEDVGIALGQAISEAAGDKKGINRYGFFLLPMDEVLIATALDLSGRMSFETNYQPTQEYVFQSNYEPVRSQVNDFPTEMVKHFFKSLVENAKMNLHFQFLNPGENEHHRVEAMFKSFGRSLRMAVGYDQRNLDQLPTTKGKL
ncbi:MAG: imidazoleglycerol-phosphate dehydratase HisB [bacterium]|nr:imidazoleglycerol-phosphate dehydratase HisB [bacterium]